MYVIQKLELKSHCLQHLVLMLLLMLMLMLMLMLFVVCCLLFVVCCLLFVVCCLLLSIQGHYNVANDGDINTAAHPCQY
jgi:protein-S-isoprenylcysteine O-methyltransferase Ste14